MGVAFLALSAGFVRAIITRGEVGVRYRSASVARVAVLGAATVSYLLLLISFVFGYDATATGWVPNEFAVNTFALRYTDWSLTVPLLCAELLAVTALAGFAYKRAQYLAIAFAFGMIFAGFLGAVVLNDDSNAGATLLVVRGQRHFLDSHQHRADPCGQVVILRTHSGGGQAAA